MDEDKIWFECGICGFKGEVEKTKTDKCPKCGEKSTALKRLILRNLED